MLKLLHAPHNSLKGKTIKSFKSNGRWRGYTLKCTDGSEFLIDAAYSNVYVEKIK